MECLGVAYKHPILVNQLKTQPFKKRLVTPRHFLPPNHFSPSKVKNILDFLLRQFLQGLK
jgi:hypothetical protein